jgi:WD40 repeat protein
VAGGNVIQSFADAENVNSLDYGPDGKSVVAASGFDAVKLWNAESGKLSTTRQGEKFSILRVAFAKDGTSVAAGSGDLSVLKLWDCAENKDRWSLKEAGGAVAFTPDGKTLAAVGLGNIILLIDAATGQKKAVLKGHTGLPVALAFSPDGRLLASGGNDRTIRLWQLSDATPKKEPDHAPKETPSKEATPPASAGATFARALDALGAADKLAKVKGVRLEGRSLLESNPISWTFTWHEITKWRLDLVTKKTPLLTCIIDGADGWLVANGKTVPLDRDSQAYLIQGFTSIGICELTPLTEKEFQFSLLGPARVEDRQAVCVKVKGKFIEDMKLYFDESTRLLTQAEFSWPSGKLKGTDIKTNTDPLQFTFSNYKETDGLKHWRRVTVRTRGKVTEDWEVTSVRYLSDVDESQFRRP